MRRTLSTTALVLSVLLVSACGSNGSASPSQSAVPAAGTIAGEGSSFASNFLSDCISKYNASNTSGHQVSYTKSSSGTGRTAFAGGSVAYAASDSPYSSGAPTFDFSYVPLVGGAVAIAYNVAGVTKLNLDAATLAYIFKNSDGSIFWDDPKIKALNETATLPHEAIINVHRADGSGTTANLQKYLSTLTGDKSWVAGDGGKNWAGAANGATSVEKANSTLLAEYIQNTPNTIGYADLSDVQHNSLNFAFLKNAAGQFVKPSAAAASKFLSLQKAPSDAGTVSIDYTMSVSGGYNLSLFTYLLMPKAAHDSVTADQVSAVSDFATYAVSTCGNTASSIGYSGLKSGADSAIYDLALTRAKL